MIYTCIGSRKTPLNILTAMASFGEQIRYEGKHWIRSGHADGADWAFEEGAQERCIVYLPWKGFNKELVSRALIQIPPFSQKLDNLAREYHPQYDTLSKGVKALMRRNGCQVLGLELDKPSNMVICYTPDGLPSGGTGQAIRIAESYRIPVINLFHTKIEVLKELIY